MGHIRVTILLSMSLAAEIMHPALGAKCTPGPVPESWATQSTPIPYVPTAEANAITLILFRHGEKKILPDGTFLENGNMYLVGQRRAQLLPARLRTMFGCPDYLVAPNPSVKIPGGGNTYYYYERPAGTIEPTATTLAFPLWMPYGADETADLSNDLLTAPVFRGSTSSEPKKVFIAWEHNNIEIMTRHIISHWHLNVLPDGDRVKVNGKTYRCQNNFTKWESCDYDSIWVLNIQGNNLCYTHMHEHLNNPSYQKACRNAERRTSSVP